MKEGVPPEEEIEEEVERTGSVTEGTWYRLTSTRWRYLNSDEI